MIKNLHHIGIAVEDLDEAVRRYRDGLGLRFEGISEVPSERVRVAILFAGETRIELLLGVGEDSPISKFVAKRGPGIHHLAFEVEDGQKEIDRMNALGMQVLDMSPRPGAHGCKVVFVHPKSMGGVLTELVEVPR
jgi:methylmalonyl-CoA/ethylmalonyl-CoA epimerase